MATVGFERFERVAGMADLTVDAYLILVRAVGDVLDRVDSEVRVVLEQGLRESAVIVGVAASPDE